ncbi:MAG: hypothetical protein IKH23_04850 [Clostridiales bacterium]|nr:hypothetical protein [Clostridiales bacterium]
MREVKDLDSEKKVRKNKKNTRDHVSSKGTVTISYRVFFLLCLIFLMLPVLIFCLGYLRPQIGIALAVAFSGMTAISVMECIKTSDGTELEKSTRDILIPVKYLIIFAVAAVAVSLITGVGEYVYTLQDHPYRRAILNDLVNYKWPVIYNYDTQTNPEVIKIFGLVSGERAFSYYFVYWLPAAVIGKLLGIGAANIALLIWNSTGVFLGFIAMCAVNKRFSYAMPFLYVFFAGLDVIPNIVYLFTGYDAWLWLEGYVPGMAFVANFTELCNVFNQMVPCFLIVAVLMMSNNMRSAGLTGGLLFAYSPWAVFGLLPIIIGFMLRKQMRSGNVKKDVLNVLTPVNIVSAILLLVVFGSYYMSNSGAVSFRGFTWTFYEKPVMFIPSWFLFIAVEIVPVTAVLFNKHKKDPVFIASAVTLCMLPLYRVSEMNDFSMRGSMPGLFIFCIMLSGYVSSLFLPENAPKTGKDWKKSAAVMLMVILMMFPAAVNLFVIAGSTLTGEKSNKDNIGSFGNIRDAYYAKTVEEQFFAPDYRNKFFYKYLSR